MRMGVLPAVASTLAPRVDRLFIAMLALTGTVAIVITLVIAVFAWRYRDGSAASRRRASPAARTRIQHRLEIAWIAVPMLIFLGLYVWGAVLYYDRSVPPADAQPIALVGKQWMWKIEHPDGVREIDQLHVPVGVPVALVMTSEDVIHSFYVPAFRVKQDVLPGRYTVLWFTATKAGDFRLYCSEYCGTDHARMLGRVVALAPAAFDAWRVAHGAGGTTMAARGAALFVAHGCAGCHGTGAAVPAPPLADLYGSTVTLATGADVIADDRYLRDAILSPRAEVVAGYAPVMPSFAGQLDESEVLELIAYIRSLHAPGPPS